MWTHTYIDLNMYILYIRIKKTSRPFEQQQQNISHRQRIVFNWKWAEMRELSEHIGIVYIRRLAPILPVHILICTISTIYSSSKNIAQRKKSTDWRRRRCYVRFDRRLALILLLLLMLLLLVAHRKCVRFFNSVSFSSASLVQFRLNASIFACVFFF